MPEQFLGLFTLSIALQVAPISQDRIGRICRHANICSSRFLDMSARRLYQHRDTIRHFQLC
jgi:hypothetical protein